MIQLMFRFSKLVIPVILLLLQQTLFGQKADLEVTRCTAIDRALTVKNVTVDASGRKWAANASGVFQIKAADLSSPVKLAPGEKNVLQFRGGNADFTFSEATFRKFVTEPCSITAAWLDAKNKLLYLGTDEAGLFQFSIEPELKMLVQWKTVNSKLKSNNITNIFQDATGRLWIGTDKGVMSGTPGRWKADLSDNNVQRIREYNTVIYVLAEGFITKAPGGERWTDLALEEKYLEGDINDFDIDPSGKMWLVSGNLTRFDMIAGTYDVFSGPEYYTSQYGNNIAVEPGGTVWVGTEDKGLFMVDKAYNMVLNAFVEKPISCEGNGKDAILMAKVTGGVEPYTWTWTGGLSGESPKDVGAGTYSVTVSDSKGKVRTAEIGVPDSRLKVKARQKKPISAPGMADGAADVDLPTNAAGITVQWDNGENLATATKLTGGEHTVTVADAKGCTVVLKVTISEVAQPVSAALVEKTKIKCFGGEGAVTVDIKGGKKPYSVVWSNPAITGENPVNVPAGDYTVTVTDATKATCTAVINLKQPDALVVSALVQAPASTGGSDGKALAQAKGGTGAFFFKWDNGETVFAATKLPPGNHVLTVTDANGCSGTANFVIPENVLTLTVSITETGKILCHGQKSALKVEAKGGKGTFKYAWSNPALSGKEPAEVPAGDYTVTVTDGAGSTQTASIRVKSPQPLTASAFAQGVVSPGGADGKALCSTAGGAVGHSFLWDNGEITAATLKLTAGLHKVTVTDENGCTATASVMMTEEVVPLEVSISEKTPIKCTGDKAALEVLVKGGKANYTYKWNNAALTGDKPTAGPGNYQLTVTDAAGATKTASLVVSAPAPLACTVEVLSALSPGKADGKAVVKPIGGTGPYTMIWSNGENTSTAAALPAGVSKVTITDANGCTATGSATLAETFEALLVNIVEKTSIKCASDKATLEVQVSGGKAGYKYAWSNPALSGNAPTAGAGNYTVTVTDANGKTQTAAVALTAPAALAVKTEMQAPLSPGKSDGKAQAVVTGGTPPYRYAWANGESAANAIALAPGVTEIAITDANGCTAKSSISMSETFMPLALSITEKTSIKCAGEKATLEAQVSGGKAGYKYNWNNPALQDASPSAPAGTYVLTVTDANGATKTASIAVSAPAPLSVKTEMQAPLSPGKSDGKAQAVVTGGTPPYRYAWANGESAANAIALAPGVTEIAITDANGCTAKASITMSETFLPLALSITEKTAIKCSGEKATLEVQVTGGKAGYKYNWSNPALQDANPAAPAGAYTLTVTDANGATKTASIAVSSPAPLAVAVEMQNPASAGNADGKALAKVSGGSGNYIFQWESGESSNTALKLGPGVSKVTVTDGNGCAAVGSVTITENITELTVSLQEKNPIKCGGLDKASLQLSIAGGKRPYDIKWNTPGLSGETPDGLVAGDYAVTVTDTKGTTRTAKITVKAPEPLVIELTQNIGASTATSTDGKAQVSIKGGTGPYKISWDNKQSGSVANKLTSGKHMVTATDAQGCTQTLEFETGKRAMPELTRAIQQGQTIPMRLLTFATDSASLRPAVYTYLDELYDFLVENPKVTIEVGGHTNNQPTDEFADYLSTARAKAVANYLTDKGIDTQRVQYKGYGKKQPLVPNTTPEGRKTNQRVEIKILNAELGKRN
ncbi:MAG TPA: OmpA family protein [Saprospiraceae bacterium]|nr:OmpA family protein [Saprospiraceae bacterium]